MPMNKCPSMPPNPLLPSIFFPQAPNSSCTELSHSNLLCTVFQLFSQPFDSHPTILCPGFPYPPCSSSHLLLGVHTAPFPTEPLSQSRSSSAVVNLSLLEIFDNAEIGSSSLNLWIFSFATDFQSQTSPVTLSFRIISWILPHFGRSPQNWWHQRSLRQAAHKASLAEGGFISLSHLNDISDESTGLSSSQQRKKSQLQGQIYPTKSNPSSESTSIDWEDIPGCQVGPYSLASGMWAPGLTFPA